MRICKKSDRKRVIDPYAKTAIIQQNKKITNLRIKKENHEYKR